MGEVTDAGAEVVDGARHEAQVYRGDNPRPLVGYLVVLAVYGLLVIVTTVIAALTGRRLPERWSIQDLVTVTLGTHKLFANVGQGRGDESAPSRIYPIRRHRRPGGGQ